MSIKLKKEFNNIFELRDLANKYFNKDIESFQSIFEENIEDELKKAMRDIGCINNVSFKYKTYNNSYMTRNDVSCPSYTTLYEIHNLMNETHGKKKAPAISVNHRHGVKSMYCPNCKKVHQKISYKGTLNAGQEHHTSFVHINVDQITCLNCDTTYNTSDIKIIDNHPEVIAGDIFYDDNKITLSIKRLDNTTRAQGTFYYQDGSQRLTFNTKTGYSFTTSTGFYYKELKSLWLRYGKNAPKMFNSTYTFEDGTHDIIKFIAKANIINNLKSLNKEERAKKIEELFYNKEKDFNEYVNAEYESLEKEIYKNLHEKIQENYSYKIKTLDEYKDELEENPQLYSYNHHIRVLKNYNRYVNLNPYTSAMDLLINKDLGLAKNKLNRNEINIANGLFKNEKISLGKKARALTQHEVYNPSLINSMAFLTAFKNPDILYNLINAIVENKNGLLNVSAYVTSSYKNAIDLWITFRGENYVAKELIQCAKEIYTRNTNGKLATMRDSAMMLKDIKKNIKDFKLEDYVTFRNEKQFHDDLSRYYNSEEYRLISEEEKYKKVFDLEEEALALENESERIFIGTNRGILSHIGREMHICVGGYYHMVESGRCRIAYIKDKNDNYAACLELQPTGKSKDNKMKYSLVQAKLKYNRLPYNNMEIYDKIKEWVEKNNIKIETHDMMIPEDLNKNKKEIRLEQIEHLRLIEEEQERNDDIEMAIPF